MAVSTFARRTAVLLALMVASGAVIVAVPPAQAADNGAWSATPVRKGEQTPRQFFFFEVTGGQTLRDAITIVNSSEVDQELFVYPADAYNTPAGAGFALRSKDEKMTDVGSWVKVSKTQVTVPANGRATVPFTMAVPDDASPGDHAGAIVTLEPAPPIPTDGNSQIVTQRALGVRLYVRVAGPLTPQLTVESVRLDAQPARLPFIGRQGGAVVTYTVRNSGNVRITANRVITLKGLFGRTLHNTGSGPIPEILPGSTVILTESFSGMPVLDQVTGRVEISEQQVGVESAGDDTAWIVSIPFLLVLLVLLVLVGFAIWWSRRGAPEVDQGKDEFPPPTVPAAPSVP